MKNKQKRIVLEITVVLFVVSLLAWVLIPKFLLSQNINTPEYIPDPQIREGIEKSLDIEPGGIITKQQGLELSNYLEISPHVFTSKEENGERIFYAANTNPEKPILIQEVYSLQGLEFFPNLTGLHFVASEKITTLDFSNHKWLQWLAMIGGKVSNASFKNCPYLSHLVMTHGSLEQLDVSSNSALSQLECWDNKLTELNVRNNEKLVVLNCRNNLLPELDISNNPVLTHLYCSENQLTGLDVTQNHSLQYLFIDNNQFTELDVSNLRQLEWLYLTENQIEEIDLSACTQLLEFGIAGNPIQEINLSNQPLLTRFAIDKEQLYNTQFIFHESARPEILVCGDEFSNGFISQFSKEIRQEIKEQIYTILNQR